MKCLYFVSEQTRRVFNNFLDYKMRDKNICIFAGMSNERDDPGTPGTLASNKRGIKYLPQTFFFKSQDHCKSMSTDL